MAANRAKIDGFLSKMRPTIFVLKFWFACDIMNKTGDNLPDKSEFVSRKVGKKRIMKIIAIAAVTAGGKTTIVNEIKQQIKNVKSLHFDDYSFKGEVDDFYA